jgi:hypothetical protein
MRPRSNVPLQLTSGPWERPAAVSRGRVAHMLFTELPETAEN